MYELYISQLDVKPEEPPTPNRQCTILWKNM
jgi:hypothetical protein